MTKLVNSRNSKENVSTAEALLHGLAPDGGLYTPMELPEIAGPELVNLSYPELAEKILCTLIPDLPAKQIRQAVYSAYTTHNFSDPEIAPLRKTDSAYFLELWHGQTSAFKDVALSLLPYLLTIAYGKEQAQGTVAILTATSGDTGISALHGFADVPHTDITVFYPVDGVSAVQKRQMQTAVGKNVHVVAVEGNFDDCQRLVKQAYTDPRVQAACKNTFLSSANSINIGRLLPQMVYYYYAYHKLVQSSAIAYGDKVNFSVPTGNFGDILAGYLAKETGLPVGRLICASNRNNVLTDFFHTGTYSLERPFYTTFSPSMDILISSNLERLLYMTTGDSAFVQGFEKDLAEKGCAGIPESLRKYYHDVFSAYYTDDVGSLQTIRAVYQDAKYCIDPHTAVACSAAKKYQKETGDPAPLVVLATASPYKFSRSVYFAITNQRLKDEWQAMPELHALTGMAVPRNLAVLKDLPVRFTTTIAQADGMDTIVRHLEELSCTK